MSKNNVINPHIPPPPIYQQSNGQYEEDVGYRYDFFFYAILI